MYQLINIRCTRECIFNISFCIPTIILGPPISSRLYHITFPVLFSGHVVDPPASLHFLVSATYSLYTLLLICAHPCSKGIPFFVKYSIFLQTLLLSNSSYSILHIDNNALLVLYSSVGILSIKKIKGFNTSI